MEEVGSKNLARISHHLPHLVSLSFSLSPSMEFIAFRMGRHGIASSRSQVAIFDHYGRLSGLREPIFKPKMLPITNKHLCIFAVLLSFNIIASFHPLFSFPFLLRIEFFVLFFHQYLSLLNTFSNPILSNSSKLGFYYKKIKQRLRLFQSMERDLIKATTMVNI